MGTLKRKESDNNSVKHKILKAAIVICRREGCKALSMRKIARLVELSAPVIYQYFASKEELMTQVAKAGFASLRRLMIKAKKSEPLPANQIIAMWSAYWNYAFSERTYYDLLFGFMAHQENSQKRDQLADLMLPVISQLPRSYKAPQNTYYAYWAAVHGLITLNCLNAKKVVEFNQTFLTDTLNGITDNCGHEVQY